MERLNLARAAQMYLSFLEAKGLSVEAMQDFEEVPAAALETDRSYQLPTFNTQRVDHTSGSAFWLFLLEDGTRIGGAAAQLQDIGTESFSGFLRRISRSQYPHPSGETVDLIAPPLDEMVSGRLAYIGELSFRTNRRGKDKVLSAFMRFLQVLVLLEWRVDWTYAFIPDRHLRASLARQYGFTRTIPSAQRWCDPAPEKRSRSEWFVGAPASELNWVFRSDLDVGDFQVS